MRHFRNNLRVQKINEKNGNDLKKSDKEPI